MLLYSVPLCLTGEPAIDPCRFRCDPYPVVPLGGQATAEEFRKHPDYAVITSFPGLADLTGARVLAELGDDHRRFRDARALKAYAGSAPVPRASGKVISITHRRIKNDRLAAVGWVWVTTMVMNQGPARQHYLRRREQR